MEELHQSDVDVFIFDEKLENIYMPELHKHFLTNLNQQLLIHTEKEIHSDEIIFVNFKKIPSLENLCRLTIREKINFNFAAKLLPEHFLKLYNN
jgi:hypothetical protein